MKKEKILLFSIIIIVLNMQCTDQNFIVCNKILINSNQLSMNVSLDSTKSTLIYPQSFIRAVMNDTDSLYAMFYNSIQENSTFYPNRYQMNFYFSKDKSQLKSIDLLFHIKGGGSEFHQFIDNYSENFPLFKNINTNSLIDGQDWSFLDKCCKYTSSLKLEKNYMRLEVNITSSH